LAEHDEALAMQLLAKLGAPPVQTFAAHSSERVTPACLRAALTGLLDPHIPSERDYHLGKAAKLTKVHYNLDGLSARLLQLALVSVALYLALTVPKTAHTPNPFKPRPPSSSERRAKYRH
jgi:hypothetical protein